MATRAPIAGTRIVLLLLWLSTLLSVALPAQERQTATVVATSLVKTPVQTGHSQAQSESQPSYTTCNGDMSTFGNFGSTHMYCSTTSGTQGGGGLAGGFARGLGDSGALQTYIYTYYTVLRTEQASYLLACIRKFRWDHCPMLLPGQRYLLSTGSKNSIVLQSDEKSKPLKLQLVEVAAIRKAPEPTLSSSAAPVAQPTTGTALVQVTSTPPGAEITVNGEFVGNTPSELHLVPGMHDVTISKPGTKSWQRTVRITEGSITIHADLEH